MFATLSGDGEKLEDSIVRNLKWGYNIIGSIIDVRCLEI